MTKPPRKFRPRRSGRTRQQKAITEWLVQPYLNPPVTLTLGAPDVAGDLYDIIHNIDPSEIPLYDRTPKVPVMDQTEIDAIAKAVIQRWTDEQFKDLGMSPNTRAVVLMTIARVAGEMAEDAVIDLLPYGHLVRNRRPR